MPTIQIEVTQDDIDKGQKGTSRVYGCPLFLAIKRKVPGLVAVSRSSIIIRNIDESIALPPTARQFQKNADSQYVEERFGMSLWHSSLAPVKPFTFQLTLP